MFNSPVEYYEACSCFEHYTNLLCNLSNEWSSLDITQEEYFIQQLAIHGLIDVKYHYIYFDPSNMVKLHFDEFVTNGDFCLKSSIEVLLKGDPLCYFENHMNFVIKEIEIKTEKKFNIAYLFQMSRQFKKTFMGNVFEKQDLMDQIRFFENQTQKTTVKFLNINILNENDVCEFCTPEATPDGDNDLINIDIIPEDITQKDALLKLKKIELEIEHHESKLEEIDCVASSYDSPLEGFEMTEYARGETEKKLDDLYLQRDKIKLELDHLQTKCAPEAPTGADAEQSKDPGLYISIPNTARAYIGALGYSIEDNSKEFKKYEKQIKRQIEKEDIKSLGYGKKTGRYAPALYNLEMMTKLIDELPGKLTTKGMEMFKAVLLEYREKIKEK